MGTLAYQYLHPHLKNRDENIEWSNTLLHASPESDFVGTPFPGDRTARASEWPSALSFASPEADFTAEKIPEAVSRPQSRRPPAPIDNSFLVSHPENAYGSVHLGEVTTESMKAEWLESRGIEYTPPLSSGRDNVAPIDAALLVSSPESAFGSTHAGEFLSDSFKAELLESQGVEYKPAKSSDAIMFQEFLDNMALMASPESASGFVASAEFLDEASKAMLSKFHARAEALPKTLEEAMADPRAIVVTSLTSPFDIVDVNEAWVGLCGYERNEALHQNLGKLLQGPDTNADATKTMVSQLQQEHFAESMITNYTKQGRRFRNRVQAGLLSDDKGQTKYFVGVLEEIFDQEGGKMAM